jgi:RNA polymerase sigma-70 factor, ECF subfamily
MSAATSYELRNTGTIKSPFITGEEATLLAAARAGDSSAFERLIMPHWDGLFRTTQRILRNREDAEDAVQTAFLDAFRNLKHFHGRSRFSSWLTRIAMNVAFMRLRMIRRKREYPLMIQLRQVTLVRVQIVETRLDPEQANTKPEQLPCPLNESYLREFKSV